MRVQEINRTWEMQADGGGRRKVMGVYWKETWEKTGVGGLGCRGDHLGWRGWVCNHRWCHGSDNSPRTWNANSSLGNLKGWHTEAGKWASLSEFLFQPGFWPNVLSHHPLESCCHWELAQRKEYRPPSQLYKTIANRPWALPSTFSGTKMLCGRYHSTALCQNIKHYGRNKGTPCYSDSPRSHLPWGLPSRDNAPVTLGDPAWILPTGWRSIREQLVSAQLFTLTAINRRQ